MGPTSSRLPVLLLLAAAACGPVERRPPPHGPEISGAHPAIGRKFDVELASEAGVPSRLRAPVGSALAVCVLPAPPGQGGADGGAWPTREDCAELLRTHGQRLSVIAVELAGPPAHAAPTYPVRVFFDPEGRVLADKLRVERGPALLLVDRQARVADVLGPADRDRLERALRGVVR